MEPTFTPGGTHLSIIHRAITSRANTFAVRTALATAALCATISQTAFATPITTLGSAVLNAGNGSVQVSGSGAGGGCIDWYNTQTPPAGCQPNGTSGTFTVEGSSSAPFLVNSTGTIQDINFNSLPLLNFIVIDLGGGNIAHFDLIDLRTNGPVAIGSCTQATGDTASSASCTPANSPFQLQNGIANNSGVVDTVTVSLTADLYGYIGNSGTNYNAANPYVGRFSTQGAVNGAFNIDSILSAIQSGGAISASWSATLSPASPTPEPASFFLIGLALVSLTPILKRTRKTE